MKNLKKQDFYFIFSDLDCFYLPLNAYVLTIKGESCGAQAPTLKKETTHISLIA